MLDVIGLSISFYLYIWIQFLKSIKLPETKKIFEIPDLDTTSQLIYYF